MSRIYNINRDVELTPKMIADINNRYRINNNEIRTMVYFSLDITFLASPEYMAIQEQSYCISDALINRINVAIARSGFFLSENQIYKELKLAAVAIDTEYSKIEDIFNDLLRLKFYRFVDTQEYFGYRVFVYPPFVSCYDAHFNKKERDRKDQANKRARESKEQSEKVILEQNTMPEIHETIANGDMLAENDNWEDMFGEEDFPLG